MSLQSDNVIGQVAREVSLADLSSQLDYEVKTKGQEALEASDGLGVPEAPRSGGRKPGNTRGPLGVPHSSLDVALIARRYVKSMIQVLVKIARDVNQSPAARVQAAKEIIARAMLEKSALDEIDDSRLKAMASALVAKMELERRQAATFTVVQPSVVVEKPRG